MTCPSCGHALNDNARFCNKCGATQLQRSAQSIPASAPAHSSTAPFVYPRQSVATVRRLAGMFCLMLGLLHLSDYLANILLYFNENIGFYGYSLEESARLRIWWDCSYVVFAVGCILLITLAVVLLLGKNSRIPAFVAAGAVLAGILFHFSVQILIWSSVYAWNQLVVLPNLLTPLLVGVYEQRLHVQSRLGSDSYPADAAPL